MRSSMSCITLSSRPLAPASTSLNWLGMPLLRWKPMRASPVCCMRLLSLGATASSSSMMRCGTPERSTPPSGSISSPSTSACSASSARIRGGTYQKHTLVQLRLAAMMNARSLLRICCSKLSARSYACSASAAHPASPFDFHASHSLNASALRPHWIERSPRSMSPYSLSGWKRYAADAALHAASWPSLRVKNAEQVRGMFICLCGFHVSESAVSTPSRYSSRRRGERNAPLPHAASTCIHRPCLSHTSRTATKGSYAPSTVVPAVAPTKKGLAPSSIAFWTAASSASGIMMPSMSVSTAIMLSLPMPVTAAPFANE
mmetsp:Transcript_11380/g.47616  ORF Transcript_11380/g.47616 Transcript_11380/m.47616 type:complete len:317 (-) Transcript_11380:1794-2744(-)